MREFTDSDCPCPGFLAVFLRGTELLQSLVFLSLYYLSSAGLLLRLVPFLCGDGWTVKEESTGVKMTKVEIVCKQAAFDTLKNALMSVGITGMTVTNVLGCGIQKGKPEYYRGTLVEANLLPKVQVEVVISKVPVRTVIETAKKALYTGHIGDGKIFVYDVENVIKVRTGEEGYDALQDVE